MRFPARKSPSSAQRSTLLHQIVLIVLVMISVTGAQSQPSGYHSFEEVPTTSHFEPKERGTLQADSLFSTVGVWSWGPSFTLDAMPGYVGIGNGDLFQILDTSVPSRPGLVWEFAVAGGVQKILFRDTLVFVIGGRSCLFVFSVANPQSPVKLSETFISGFLSNAAINGPSLFISSSGGVVYEVDISNPSAPTIRQVILLPISSSASITSQNKSVYVGGPGGLFVARIDLSNPDSIYSHIVWTMSGRATSLLMSDSLLLEGRNGSVGIYSLAKVDSPLLLSRVTIAGTVTGMAVEGPTVYCLTRSPNLVYSVDISNVRQPEVRTSIAPRPPSIGGGAIVIIDTTVFASFRTGLFVAKKVSGDSLSQMAFFPTGYSVDDIVIKDSIAFLASGYAGLWIVNVAQPSGPVPIGNLQSGAYAFRIAKAGNVVCMIGLDTDNLPDSLRGLWIVGVEDVSTPTTLSFLPLSNAISVAVTGDLAFASRRAVGPQDTMLTIVNISNPREPHIVGALLSQSEAFQMSVKDSFLLVASVGLASGLQIVDWSNPSAPAMVLTVLPWALGVLVTGDTVYVDRADSVIVFDFSTPSNPIRISQARRGGGSFGSTIDLALKDHRLLWAGGSKIGAFDFSNLSAPYHLGSQQVAGGTSVAVSGALVLVGNGLNGLQLMRLNDWTSVSEDPTNELPASISLTSYPNPFNSHSWIEFRLPEAGQALLELYDILGRRVRTITNQSFVAGDHRVALDGSSLSSGVYYVVLRSRYGSMTHKTLLIR